MFAEGGAKARMNALPTKGEMEISDREAHLRGLYRLIDPREKERLKRAFESIKSRERWLRRLFHQIEMHPEFAEEPPRGSRDEDSLFKALRDLGAPEMCYVIASDSDMDDSFQSLRQILTIAYVEFAHGTILSCIPGKLALFRTAYPHKHFIVHRH